MSTDKADETAEPGDHQGGKASKGKELVRQCAVTREQLATDVLVRFVLSPDGVVTPDLKRKLPGRGVWVQARRALIAEAVKRNQFARSFRQAAKAGADLPELVENLLKKEALNALSLANKAGLVITGYEKIRAAIGKGNLRTLLHALDASDNGSDKLDRMVLPRKVDEEAQYTASCVLPRLFTSEELSLALGRGNVVHIGLKQGEAARRFEQALDRAAAYITEEGVALSTG